MEVTYAIPMHRLVPHQPQQNHLNLADERSGPRYRFSYG